ncbi:TPA: DnaD domain protein [Clostridioides difficile]|uniref:DnaD domain protein n=1 Tax=Clostridioides difficile TaxID=1496 RepID=UPI00097FDE7A|nr:DnaD domain protein [Clostridioides difficile]SJP19058.1 DnaD domain protein [Clostridioides difficile]HBF0844894.1 DnaD domain protein [Clostridioides difficile]
MKDRDKATIEKGNILSDGYGLSPQLVARDSWLTTGARALYFYLSSFAGASGTCYPSRDIMTHELGINKDTFSKYLNELKTSGYIKVYKNKTREGRMQNNIYEVVFDRSYIESHISIRCKKENKKKPCPNLPDMVQPDMEKSDTISNSIINNSFKSSMYIEQAVDNSLKEFKKLYEENIGVVYPVTAEWLLEVSNEVDIRVFKRAIEICAERMSMNLSYLKGILKKWKDANITTYEQLESYKLQHENKKSKKPNSAVSKNKFANFEQTFTQYSNKELDEIIKKSQKAKFK